MSPAKVSSCSAQAAAIHAWLKLGQILKRHASLQLMNLQLMPSVYFEVPTGWFLSLTSRHRSRKFDP